MEAHTERDEYFGTVITVGAGTSIHRGVGGDPDKTTLAKCNLPALDGELDANGNAEETMLLRDSVGPLTEAASPLPDSGEVAALGSGEANVEPEESAVLDTSRSSSAATAPEHRSTQREEARGNGQTGEGSDRTNFILNTAGMVVFVGGMLIVILPSIAPTLIEGIEAGKALLEAMGL